MRALVLAFAVVLSACAPGALPSPTPVPTALSDAALKYRIVDQLGRPFFCDPDFYPVARADEQSLADARFGEIAGDAPTFAAILTHAAIAPAATYTAEQRLAIYRDWKMLNALRLEPSGTGFHFTAVFTGAANPPQYARVDATVDRYGTLAIASRTATGAPPCPICLAIGTRIATPDGDTAVESLRAGDVVWTLAADGTRIAAPLAEVGSTAVPATHRVVHLVLSDGRTVDVSPGHPTVDGRRVGDLALGDAYDGATVVGATLVAYAGAATYDVLPSGATGAYWANGVALRSTLP